MHFDASSYFFSDSPIKRTIFITFVRNNNKFHLYQFSKCVQIPILL
jgi:hypothetical protein